MRPLVDLAPHVLEASHDGCVVVDDDGIVQYANPALHTLLDADAALEGASLLALVHPDDRDDVVASWGAVGRFRPGRITRFRLRRSDGAFFNVEAALARTSGPDDEGLVVCNIRAAQARRSLEAAMRHIQRLLEQLEDLVGSRERFVVALAHQLRTPLAALVSGSELLVDHLEDIEPATTTRSAEIVRRNAWRMRDLVAQFTRVDTAHGMTPDGPSRRRFDAGQLLQQVVAELYADDAQVTIDVRCEDELVVDREAVADALRALLDNAITHTPPGTPVHLEAADADGGWTFAVSDGGPGVPDGRRRQVFAPFVTHDVPPYRPTVGLGLHLVELVARDHDGWARYETSELGGARFVMHVGAP